MFLFRKQNRIFVKKMKKILIIFSLFAVLAVLSSCGMYKEPCEGVSSIEISDKKI